MHTLHIDVSKHICHCFLNPCDIYRFTCVSKLFLQWKTHLAEKLLFCSGLFTLCPPDDALQTFKYLIEHDLNCEIELFRKIDVTVPSTPGYSIGNIYIGRNVNGTLYLTYRNYFYYLTNSKLRLTIRPPFIEYSYPICQVIKFFQFYRACNNILNIPGNDDGIHVYAYSSRTYYFTRRPGSMNSFMNKSFGSNPRGKKFTFGNITGRIFAIFSSCGFISSMIIHCDHIYHLPDLVELDKFFFLSN